MNEYQPTPRPFKLVVPVVALLALTLDLVLFIVLENRVTAEHAAYISAGIAFVAVVVIGKAFKPLLGE